MTQASSGPRRFLALVFPFLAADLVRRQAGQGSLPGGPGASPARRGPLVFTVKQRGAFRLHALDEDALAAGLEPGMPLADARARIPDLVDLPHDPEGEAAWLEALATQAERFTPMVAIDPPEALILDMTGCAHLFGGEQHLAREAARFMTRQGLRTACARASTPEAALALARFSTPSTASIPLPFTGGARGGPFTNPTEKALPPTPSRKREGEQRDARAHSARDNGARAPTPEAASAVPRLGKGAASPPLPHAGGGWGEGPYLLPHTPTPDESPALLNLPLLALRTAPDTLIALHRAGFATLGDLAPLPRGPLAARFGAATLDALDRLLGRTDSRITPRRLPPPVLAERRFAEPVARIETVMAVIGELLAQVCETLLQRHEGGRVFALRLFRSDGAERSLAVETGAPVRDPPTVLRLLAERIEALSDPLDPGFGFDSVRFAIPRTEPLAATQDALVGGRSRSHAFSALVDRLGARLGARRFCHVLPQGSHIPERATMLRPVGDSAPATWEPPLPGEPPLRPIALFDPPERIEVLAAVPDGPPRSFRWRGSGHRIVAYEGPERISPEWWCRRGGHDVSPGLSRDYYRVEDETGARFWLFRHGLYERETNTPNWYVHGLFA